MTIATTVTPFDHQHGGDFPGSRGVVMDTERPGPGFAYSTSLPSLFISDNDEVSLDEYRVPADDMLAWFEAAAEAIRSRREIASSASR
ncbi:hypothetical protein ACEYYH_10375 [Microbacterium trichothecenolyticum]|uniref:hypothetical protein n=1 Tax=Microbacterium trichothecenolyticum TaxID=69370 RepID=UPI0035BE8B95